MDEPPRDPPPQPEPAEPGLPATPAPEPAPEPTGWIPPAPGPDPAPEPTGWIPPAESKPSRIVIRVLAASPWPCSGLLVFTIFIGSRADPREAAANDYGRRLMEMPEFQARYGDVDSPERAFELGQQLGDDRPRPPRRPEPASLLGAHGGHPPESGRQHLHAGHAPDRPARTGTRACQDPRRGSVQGVDGGHVQGVRG